MKLSYKTCSLDICMIIPVVDCTLWTAPYLNKARSPFNQSSGQQATTSIILSNLLIYTI